MASQHQSTTKQNTDVSQNNLRGIIIFWRILIISALISALAFLYFFFTTPSGKIVFDSFLLEINPFEKIIFALTLLSLGILCWISYKIRSLAKNNGERSELLYCLNHCLATPIEKTVSGKLSKMVRAVTAFCAISLIALLVLIIFLSFTSLTGMVLNKSQIIENTTLDSLTILEILLAFLGLAGASIYIWISKSIREEEDKKHIEERLLSHAEYSILSGIFDMSFYNILYLNEKKRWYKNDGGQKAKKLLDSALDNIKYANKQFEGVNIEKNVRLWLTIKNNFAYYLAMKWYYYRDGDYDLRKSQEALQFKNSLTKYLQTDGIKKVRDYESDKKRARAYVGLVNKILLTHNIHIERKDALYFSFADTELWVDQVFVVDTSETLTGVRNE